MAAVIDDANYHQPVNDGGHVHNFDHHRSGRCQLVCQKSMTSEALVPATSSCSSASAAVSRKPPKDRASSTETPDLHVLWGWLQIDRKHRADDIGPNDVPWARHHPHVFGDYRDDQNTVYAASMKVDLGSDDAQRGVAGWGVFPRFDRRLVLTDPNGTGVSQWRLPRWFYPDGNKPPLTYHSDLGRWRRDADHAYLRTTGRGQGFVIDIAHHPEAVGWLSDLVNSLDSTTRG